MKKLEGIVEMAGGCYYNMIRSIVEAGPREVLGDLIGKKYKGNFILINAYPFLTAELKPTEAFYGNEAARERLRELNKALNKLGGLGYSIVGQYHSHIYKVLEERENGFGKKDIDFFVDEMEKLKRKESVQIILTVKSKEYTRKYPTGEFITKYPKKLRLILRNNTFHCYDISISAFRLSKDKKLKELKVCRRKIKFSRVK